MFKGVFSWCAQEALNFSGLPIAMGQNHEMLYSIIHLNISNDNIVYEENNRHTYCNSEL